MGDFKSRVFAVGPQLGYIFPVAGQQGYLNLKGYKEFGAEHRPEGWNVWLTLVISPAAPTPPAPPFTILLRLGARPSPISSCPRLKEPVGTFYSSVDLP